MSRSSISNLTFITKSFSSVAVPMYITNCVWELSCVHIFNKLNIIWLVILKFANLIVLTLKGFVLFAFAWLLFSVNILHIFLLPSCVIDNMRWKRMTMNWSARSFHCWEWNSSKNERHDYKLRCQQGGERKESRTSQDQGHVNDGLEVARGTQGPPVEEHGASSRRLKGRGPGESQVLI